MDTQFRNVNCDKSETEKENVNFSFEKKNGFTSTTYFSHRRVDSVTPWTAAFFIPYFIERTVGMSALSAIEECLISFGCHFLS